MEALISRGPNHSPTELDRAQFANDAGADLFLSLHSDRNPSPRAQGVASFHFGTGNGTTRPSASCWPASSSARSRPAPGMRDCRTHHKTWEHLHLHPLPGGPGRDRLPDEPGRRPQARRPGVPRHRRRGHPDRGQAPVPARRGRPADGHVHVRRRPGARAGQSRVGPTTTPSGSPSPVPPPLGTHARASPGFAGSSPQLVHRSYQRSVDNSALLPQLCTPRGFRACRRPRHGANVCGRGTQARPRLGSAVVIVTWPSRRSSAASTSSFQVIALRSSRRRRGHFGCGRTVLKPTLCRNAAGSTHCGRRRGPTLRDARRRTPRSPARRAWSGPWPPPGPASGRGRHRGTPGGPGTPSAGPRPRSAGRSGTPSRAGRRSAGRTARTRPAACRCRRCGRRSPTPAARWRPRLPSRPRLAELLDLLLEVRGQLPVHAPAAALGQMLQVVQRDAHDASRHPTSLTCLPSGRRGRSACGRPCHERTGPASKA